MLTANDITATLRQHLPAEVHPAVYEAISALAQVLADVQTTSTPQSSEAQATLEARLAADPNLAAALHALAGQDVKVGGDSVISFGSGAQLGDVSIGDVAGRDVVKLHVDVHQSLGTQQVINAQTGANIGSVIGSQANTTINVWMWDGFGEAVPAWLALHLDQREQQKRDAKERLDEAELERLKQEARHRWSQIDWTRAAQNYCEKIVELYGSMHIFGMSQPVPLANVFTDVYLLDKPRQLSHQLSSPHPRPARDRALNLASDLASALASALASSRAHARDRARARARDRDLDIDLEISAKLFINIDRELIDVINGNFKFLIAHTFGHARAIDIAHAGARIATRFADQITGQRRASVNVFPRQDWHLGTAQLETLGGYLSSTELLLDCLDLAAIEDRQAVLDQLLVPPKSLVN